MELHFYTRDLQQDYPRIGWIPVLSNGANDLWLNFSDYHAGEYPEILLSQHDGKWQLYLSAIDSGRTDSITGTGRPIRVSLYLSGDCSDGNAVMGLIAQYLYETMNRQEADQKLKKLFLSKIKAGEPNNWKELTGEEQKAIADGLLKELVSFSVPSEVTELSAKHWIGGCSNPDVLCKFITHCKKLLSGEWNGMAISLANLSLADVSKVLASMKREVSIALLLSTLDEREKAYQALPEIQNSGTNPTLPVRHTIIPTKKSVIGKK